MSDSINRQDVPDTNVGSMIRRQEILRAFEEMCSCTDYGWDERDFRDLIKKIPSADPETKEIGYVECSSALLKMWMDGVLTDREYDRITDKLNNYKWASGGVR